MAQYLLSVHMVEGEETPSDEEMQRMYAATDALNREMQDKGVWVYANGLQPADIATVVKVQNDKLVTTDGPFSEAKEHIGGFWILEVTDLDAALEWAGKATRACGGPVEVRPFQTTPDA
ncbi:YciI family protein [Rhodococcus sp. NPDC058521]|uniref:YciI family protein n=1 Tax=Rhodococcus sp. NPDC058521 TaxID=3346536 RepID=UPI003653CA66